MSIEIAKVELLNIYNLERVYLINQTLSRLMIEGIWENKERLLKLMRIQHRILYNSRKPLIPQGNEE